METANATDFRAALLAIIKTILHESVHYGDWEDGKAWYDEGIFNDEIGNLFEADVYWDGDIFKTYNSLNNLKTMQDIINRKMQMEDGWRDIPGTSWSEFDNWLERALEINPNIRVTYQ